MMDMEIAAFPFIIKKGKLRLMIITTCSGNAWILPKGQPESDMKDAQVALMEASEEAGVVGQLVVPAGYKDFKRKGGGSLRVYPLSIQKILRKWPEKAIRKRQLVSVREALSLVNRKEHVNAINYYTKPDNLIELSQAASDRRAK